MKKIFTCLLITYIVMCAVSCGDTPENNMSVVESADLDVFKVYELDTGGQKVRFADMIESVEFMRLEETDASLLSYVNELVETDDYYLLSSGKEGDIFFYGKDGSYQSKINRKGEGPEEYKSIQDKWVRNDTLFVYSDEQQKIKQYQRDGSFAGSLDMPVVASQVVPYAEGYALDMNMNFTDDSLAYNIVLLDENLNREALMIPFEKAQSFGISTDFNGFKKYGEDLIYLRVTNDTLFLLRGKEVTPLAKFDFGRNWLWNDEGISKDPNNIMQIMQNSQSVWNLGVNANKKWYYLNFMSNFLGIDGLMIDRARGTYRIINYKVSQEEKYTMNALDWQGDRLLFSISSLNVVDLLSELDESKLQFRKGTTLEEIESSENPVMMWVKFKDKLE